MGAGVIGLCTAVVLQEAGLQVKVVSRAYSPSTTSDKAAAIWLPFVAEPREHVARWSSDSYLRYRVLSRRPGTGVRFLPLVALSRESASELPWWLAGLPSEKPAVLLAPQRLPRGYAHGVEVEIPLIESPVFMPYLLRRFVSAGGHFETRTVDGWGALTQEADWVIDCTGLGAAELSNDRLVYPIRGQLLKVRMERPPEKIWVDDEAYDALAYIIPRSDGVLLGGTLERGVRDEATDPAALSAIRERCEQILPELRSAEVIDQYAGLRPARSSIRLEVDPSFSNLIHNYGHGGSGYTVCWGCAEAVLRLIQGRESEA